MESCSVPGTTRSPRRSNGCSGARATAAAPAKNPTRTSPPIGPMTPARASPRQPRPPRRKMPRPLPSNPRHRHRRRHRANRWRSLFALVCCKASHMRALCLRQETTPAPLEECISCTGPTWARSTTSPHRRLARRGQRAPRRRRTCRSSRPGCTAGSPSTSLPGGSTTPHRPNPRSRRPIRLLSPARPQP